ncbi:hypothetical protein AJ79_06584 [Helicocarpus griseus UAMH5409]|uniref:Aminoglycoside phosphotransferase domain-containing protein n=1 Tax=Helicocarpus griseus UAMH5409 TaxID=1447875 RepID=A0A2B7XAR8_9EURO|nr:hypothetical protein AJ79_06584 [Helicocarpus griseus UAMH5409]
MEPKQKAQLILRVVWIEHTLASTEFTEIGGLYYKDDLPATMKSTASPLYVNANGDKVHRPNFGVGPTNHRQFFDFGRGKIAIDRGQWSTPIEYVTAIAHREIASAKAQLKYPLMSEGLFSGPRQYQPNYSAKLSALQNYLKVARYVLPENKATHASVLWHGDLNSENIFVDPKDPSRILGIIDWQSVSAYPLFMQVTLPAFLNYNGPPPKDMSKVPLPANYDSMGRDEQKKAKELQNAQILLSIYLVRSFQGNTDAFQAMKGKDTLRHRVSVTPGLTFMDYEPCLDFYLKDVKTEWPNIVGVGIDGLPLKPCPLQFSAAELEQKERAEDLWAQGVKLMDDFIDDTGAFKHWDGRVTHAEYELAKKQLDEGVERFLNREARKKEERKAWLKVLPFVD